MRFCRLAKALRATVIKFRNDLDMSVPEFAAQCGIDCSLMYEIKKGRARYVSIYLYENMPPVQQKLR